MGLTRNDVTGFVFIVSVSLIWSASSVLLQYLYESKEEDFHSPFMVTYIGVSLFTLFLPRQKLAAWIVRIWLNASGLFTRQHYQQPVRDHERSVRSEGPDPTEPLVRSISNDDIMYKDGHDDTVTAQLLNNTNPQTADTILHRLEVGSPDPTVVPVEILGVKPWTDTDHLRAAFWIAPVWFIANWAYNASLIYTSVTSSTVLASTGSLFAFWFAVLASDEPFHGTKLAGIVVSVAGGVLTALHDATPHHGTRHLVGPLPSPAAFGSPASRPLLGDVWGLLSAVGYGMYAVQTRVLCPADESLSSMPTLLGYIGLWNMVLFSPVFVYQFFSGQAELTGVVLGFLVVKGLLDNVLSDYLWLRAVLLTNATTATVGLGLTIPLAFASDIVLGKANVLTIEQVVGALAILTGFLLVNIGNRQNPDLCATKHS